MLVPLPHSWVQPSASFATRHATPGRVLATLVFGGNFAAAHKQNEIAISVISDGATANKAAWAGFKVTEKFHAPNHQVKHPCAS